MTEFPQDSRLRAEEDMQSSAFRAQADGGAPALNADFNASAAAESYDALDGQSPSSLANPALADLEAKGVASGWTENLSGGTAEVNNVWTPLIQIPPLTKPGHETSELYNEIKQRIAHRTCLADDGSALAAFWAISTWFREVLEVFPLLLISGSAHEALGVLNVLDELCYQPVLLAGFRRGDLKDLRGGTLLISEPNLDNRAAALFGNLTNRKFHLFEDRSLLGCAGSMAIYAGEDSATKKIPHSIHVHAAPALTHDALAHRSAQEKIDGLRSRIHHYSTSHLARVRSLDFNPCGLSSEASVIANALGSCIVGAPELQTQLVALLKPQARQWIADRSESDEALVLAAVIELCNQEMGHVFAREIAAEVNRLLAARGETRLLSPEKVGHKLKKLGLFTRTLSHAGNGLILDQPTRKRLREVAAAYSVEGLILRDRNLHCSSDEKSEVSMEDVEDMKDLPF
jgi:hypothetical protein